MPRRSHRSIRVNWILGKDLLAISLALTYAVTVTVTSLETVAINFRIVAKASVMVVMRAFGFIALLFLTIRLAGLETVLVTLVHRLFAIAENILAITAAVW